MKWIAAILSVFITLPLAAQDFEVDGHWIDRCLAIQDDPMICVGREADRCTVERGEGQDMIHAACFEAEAIFWDGVLDETYGHLMSLAHDREVSDLGYQPDALVTALRKMQNAWNNYRDATCDNAMAIAAPFGSVAGRAFAECRMTLTAEQYFVLQNMRHDYIQ